MLFPSSKSVIFSMMLSPFWYFPRRPTRSATDSVGSSVFLFRFASRSRSSHSNASTAFEGGAPKSIMPRRKRFGDARFFARAAASRSADRAASAAFALAYFATFRRSTSDCRSDPSAFRFFASITALVTVAVGIAALAA